MTAGTLALLGIAAALGAYLTYVMIRPERF